MSTTLAPPSTVVLHERTTGGILVELVYHRFGEKLEIRVTEPGQLARSGRVPVAKGMDAFTHPYTYLAKLPV